LGIPWHWLFLAVGLCAASQSGNLVRLGHAPAEAIAAWRLLMASAVLLPFAWRQRAALANLGRTDWAVLGLAGLALAAHLVTWIAGVQHTTVANAMLFFAVNPVFTALGARLYGERATPRLLLSIALGLVGVAVIGVGDLSLARDQLPGDGLALLSAALFSAYFLLGKHVRKRLPNTLYVALLYGVAAIACFSLLAFEGAATLAYDPQTWLCFGLMALIPTLLGHSALNHALRWLPASRIAAATLVEPLLGGMVALLPWREPLTPAAGLGYTLIAASVLVLAGERRHQS
jgi:drug/metabolite transporter (DMT)-like permease